MKKLLLTVLVAAQLMFSLPTPAYAQDEGLIRVDPLPGMAKGELVPAIKTIVNLFLTLVGLVAAIFLVVAGVRYITSGSNEQGQEKAKHQILYAVIGLIVIGLAAAVVNFTLLAIDKGGGAGGGGGGGGAGGGGGEQGQLPGGDVRNF